MTEPTKARSSFLLTALAGVAVASLLLIPILLHFSLKSHSAPAYQIETNFPPGVPFQPGEVFGTTMAELVDHELASPFGWRPNDLSLWGPTLWADNNANRQLGIIQALRESARVLRDNLTKVSATEYDQNLLDADTKFRNDEYKFWFPSAESRFEEASDALRRYVDGLRAEPQLSKPINRRNVELIRLFQAWTDLLGSAHANLYNEEVSFLSSDDHFYRSQGLAHVMAHLLRAIRREYQLELQERATVLELLVRVQLSLDRAAVLKPLVVIDGSPSGVLANHRRNLDAYIVDARQLMYSVREELEK
jgi:hypothetical protein